MGIESDPGDSGSRLRSYGQDGGEPKRKAKGEKKVRQEEVWGTSEKSFKCKRDYHLKGRNEEFTGKLRGVPLVVIWKSCAEQERMDFQFLQRCQD